MIDPKVFSDLAKKICETIPDNVKELQKDIERNVQAALQSTFAKLNLVTREEFDAQVKVLARTRSKLQKLEKQVAELEEKFPPKKTQE